MNPNRPGVGLRPNLRPGLRHRAGHLSVWPPAPTPERLRRPKSPEPRVVGLPESGAPGVSRQSLRLER